MSSLKLRFNVALENDRKWAVIDSESDLPASFGAEVLQGLTALQAETFATILNEIHPPRIPPANAAADEAPLSMN